MSAQAELDVTDYGWVARLNDLHKGRHSGEAWKWLIDASALLMLVFILSGVALLLPKKHLELRTALVLGWVAIDGRCLPLAGAITHSNNAIGKI